MQIEEIAEMIFTPDGQMPAFLYRSVEHGQKPAVLLLMEAFGLTLISERSQSKLQMKATSCLSQICTIVSCRTTNLAMTR